MNILHSRLLFLVYDAQEFRYFMGEPVVGSELSAVTLIYGKACVWEVNTQKFLNARTLYIVIVACQSEM
jgi:hypothetical protein